MDEMTAQVQAQASTFLLCGQKGGKYSFTDLIGNTRAIVSDEYFNRIFLRQKLGLCGNESF
jgi:hypothetical protein